MTPCRSAAVAAFLIALLSAAAGAARAERCWNETSLFANPDNGTARNPRFKVMRLAPFPKRVGDAAYAYHPVSIAFRQPNPTFFDGPAQMDGVEKYALMWGNRCHPTASSSPTECVGWGAKAVRLTINRTEYDVFFTSVAKADACTRAQVLATVGAPQSSVRAPLEENGVVFATSEAPLREAASRLTSEEQRRAWAGVHYDKYAAAKALNRGAWLENVCYVPTAAGGPLAGMAPHVAGIIFDWEVADRRSPDQTASFMEAISREVRRINPSMKVFLSNDPVHGAGKFAGISPESGPRLLKALDGVEIFIEERPQPIREQLDAQMRVFGGGAAPADRSKFIVAYHLTRQSDAAQEAREVLLSGGFKYVMLGQAWVADKQCDASNKDSSGNRQLQELFALPPAQ